MENNIVVFPKENVLMEFKIGDQQYAVIGESEKLDEENGDSVYFVKIDNVDGEKIARNIEDEKELVKVQEQFNDFLYSLGDDGNDR